MRNRVDVALATALELDEPDLDLAPLGEALAEAGLSSRVLAWDDPDADFGSAAVTVLRSTWNYPLVTREFLAWVEATAQCSALWNPPAIVRWNAHKGYLLELAGKGVPIVPTELVVRGSKPGLAKITGERGWENVVVKPAVSASSRGTLAFTHAELALGEAHLARLADVGDVLVQQYLSSVEGYGERALIWIDGELTHAVRKSPRFQGDCESTSIEAVPITAAERTLAARALSAATKIVDEELLYARIDVAPGDRGAPVLMELELVEPSLYLSRSEAALDGLVRAIALRVGSVAGVGER